MRRIRRAHILVAAFVKLQPVLAQNHWNIVQAAPRLRAVLNTGDLRAASSSASRSHARS